MTTNPETMTSQTMNAMIRPSLYRTLSEHHWDAAAREMIRKNTTYQWAGSYMGMNNSARWEYFISRGKSTDNEVFRHNVCYTDTGDSRPDLPKEYCSSVTLPTTPTFPFPVASTPYRDSIDN